MTDTIHTGPFRTFTALVLLFAVAPIVSAVVHLDAGVGDGGALAFAFHA